MPKFAYTAVGPDGQMVKGVEDAVTASLAERAVSARDLELKTLEEKKTFFTLKMRKKVPRRELMHFSRQLAVFVRAGINILEAIDTIAEETVNKPFKDALTGLSEALRAGDTFSGAIGQQPEAFPPFYLGIVRSAELTGNLDMVLEQVAEYIERDVEARRKIRSALTYPAVILVMSGVTVVVLTAFVLPRFETFFANLHAKLPLSTRILLNTSNFLGQWWYLFLGGFVALGLGIFVGLRTENGKVLRDRTIIRLPVMGDIARHAILERFCRILGSMVRAGVPLPEAMIVSAEGTNNEVYRRGLAEARQAMLRGEGLAQPLAATGLFPAAARQMIRVGEETGSLDQQLQTAAIYYDRELDFKIKRFTDLFEPAVIIMMGLVVGFVAVALVSAMYGIFNQVQV